MVVFPPVPPQVKPVAHLLKLADEHESRNIVVTYWARMAACLMALKIVPGKKPPEVSDLIRALLDWLEQCRKDNADNEGITNETAAHAIIENYAIRLFEYGDQQDKAELYNKNIIKTFYTTGILMDVLDQFGPISEDIREKRKYAKWKAAYIHHCLKLGHTPMPGPPRDLDENPTGITRNDEMEQDELATFKKYDGPVDFNNLFPEKPPVTMKPPEDFVGLLPNPIDEHSKAPAPSPITPQNPNNPSSTFPAASPSNQSPPMMPSVPSNNPTPYNTPNIGAPQQQPSPNAPEDANDSSGSRSPTHEINDQLTPEQVQLAQKYCKYATSALNYDDIKTALDNLYKAIDLLTMESE